MPDKKQLILIARVAFNAQGERVLVDRKGALPRNEDSTIRKPDFQRFKELTVGNTIVMGRKTLESFRTGPLADRQNIVITSDRAYSSEGVIIAYSLEDALKKASSSLVYIIGGAQVYRSAIERIEAGKFKDYHKTIDLNELTMPLEGTLFFPKFRSERWEKESVQITSHKFHIVRYTYTGKP